MVCEIWKCPHCRARHWKEERQGAPRQYLPGGLVMYEVSQTGRCPTCGGEVSGADILTGRWDDNLADAVHSLNFIGCGCLGWIIGAIGFALLVGGKAGTRGHLLTMAICIFVGLAAPSILQRLMPVKS